MYIYILIYIYIYYIYRYKYICKGSINISTYMMQLYQSVCRNTCFDNIIKTIKTNMYIITLYMSYLII